MKKLYTVLGALIIGAVAFGQSYNFDALTSGSTGTLGNGWVGSTTTGYRWIALAGSTPSSGTGPNIDHTLGTSSGIFVYVEASSPAAAGNTTSLTSPNMSTTGFTNPGLSFWYHMAGTGMGDMYIDVYNGTAWTLAVDSLIGAQQLLNTDPWQNKIVNLVGFSGTIKVRFRAIYGSDWAGDMAVDDVSFVEMPPYDANLIEMIPSHYYYMMPIGQVQPMTYSGLVGNDGGDTVTNVTVSGTISPPGFSFSGSITQLNPLVVDTVNITTAITPNATGLYIGNFTVSVTESDTTLFNDSAQFQFEVSDTVLAREDGNINQGIGFTSGSGMAGQMFEVFTQDSLSSVSFLLAAPTVNQTLKLKLFTWNTSTGEPGAILDSTAIFTVPSTDTTWYDMQFTCDRILPVGKYFVAVEQLGTTNMALGYTPAFFETGTALFEAGSGWTTLESVGFEVTLGIRMNFGPVSFPSVTLGSDTGYCTGGSVALTAPTGWSSYSWSNGGNSATTTVTVADSNFWLQVKDSRGCAVRDTIIVIEYPLPMVNLQPTVGVCNGASATLVANNDPTYTYLWNTGSTDSSITVSAAGLYAVTVTSAQGCTATGFTSLVSGATPMADIGFDTIYFCTGSSTSVTALGTGNAYLWSNGTTGSTVQISTPGMIILTVTSPGSCVAYDTAWVVETSLPSVNLSSNSISFCDNETGAVSVNMLTGATYLWSTGETGVNIALAQSGQFWVETTLDGCSSSDTGTATILASPVVNLGADSVICDTSSIQLDAGAGASWIWSTGASTQTINVNTAGNYSVIVENNDGCKGSDTITINVETCVGIFEVAANTIQVSAYPNPASNEVTISMGTELLSATIKVLDVKGAVVYQQTVQSEIHTINVSEWAVGVYTVQLTKGDLYYSTKIVVQH